MGPGRSESANTTEIRTELKEVTVLFADVVNSTRLIQAMDPERASDLLDPVIKIMIETVCANHGTVTRIIGDGIMAIFGAPVSQEEHAVQACFSALDMLEQIHAVQGVSGENLKIRIGIDSGQVLVRNYSTDLSSNYDAVGFAAHLASKLEAIAEPNTACISERSLHLVQGFVSAESAGAVRLDEVSYPAYRLKGKTEISRWSVRRSRVLCGMVGRESHLNHLQSSVDRMLRGNGSSILLEGEAGIGKSRLLHEFDSAVKSHGVCVVRLEGALYHQRTMFLPFRELFSVRLKIDRNEHLSSIDQKLAMLLTRYNLSTDDRKLALCSLFNPDIEHRRWTTATPEWRRQIIVETLTELIGATSKETPTILIAEDLHLLDDGSLEVLEKVTELARWNRLVLVASQRSDQAVYMAPTKFDDYFSIDPLSPDEVALLCDSLLGADSALDFLKRELVARTGGIPLFVEETILDLQDAGTIRGMIGGMSTAIDASVQIVDRLPSSISAILSARIDRLPDDCKSLLRLASVIGGRFPSGLLKLASNQSEDLFDRILVKLQAVNLIIGTGERSENSISFSHALARDVCFRGMIKEVRRHQHAVVARAIETYYAGRQHEFTKDLAYHYSEAGQHLVAIRLWRDYAQRAQFGAAHAEAVDALKTAVELSEKLDDSDNPSSRKLGLLTLLGSALIVTQGPGSEEVASVYAECRALAKKLGEARELFRSLWGQWRIAWRVPNKVLISEQLSELALQSNDHEDRLQAHHAQWAACFHNGEHERSLDNITEGLKLYDHAHDQAHLLHYGGHDPSVCAYGEAALCHWILGNAEKGREMMTLALDEAKRIDHPGSIGHAFDYAMFYLQHAQDVEQLSRHCREAVTFATEMSLPHYIARADAWIGWVMYRRGDCSNGIAHMTAAIDDQRQTGIEEDFPVFLEVLAGLKADDGDLDGALNLCDDALALCQESGMQHWLAEIHRRRGEVLRRLGPNQHDAAVQSFEESLSIAKAQGAQAILSRIHSSLDNFPDARELLMPDGLISVAPRGERNGFRSLQH